MSKYFLSLDVGTTGARAITFDEAENIVASEYSELSRTVREGGIVEQNPLEYVDTAIGLMRSVVRDIPLEELVSVGIATQRETTLMWERRTGKPLYPAIVWQDARTESWCGEMKIHEELVREKTGLAIIPYFSASKICWLLQNIPGARADGAIFGTPDTWLLYNLTEERIHRSDYTNASRTLLYNIHTREWDSDLFSVFGVPREILPSVHPSHFEFGTLRKDILGKNIPICAVVGDQQASLFAAGSAIGTTKVTFGTGVFVMQIVPENVSVPAHFFMTLTADSPAPCFALEGKVGYAAERISPVLSDPERLEQVMDEIAKETLPFLESLPITPTHLVADGGGSQNDFLLKRLSDLSSIPATRHKTHNGTALGTMRLLV